MATRRSWRVLLPLLLLLAGGCSYLSDRGNDLADCGKLEGQLGLLPGAWAMAGPVVHTGIGLPDGPIQFRYGYRYNYRNRDGGAWLFSSGSVHGSDTFEYYFVGHGSHGYPQSESEHVCYALFPPLLNREGVHRNWIRDFDVEAGFVALLGLTAGFSLGEFLDFLLGWFGIDIAGDDEESVRKDRNYFRDRAGHPGPILPKKDGS